MPKTPLYNSTALLTYRIIDNILAFIFFAVTARLLGSDIFGKFCYAFSIAVLFKTLADWGLSLFTIREIARAREDIAKLAGKISVVRITLTFCLWIFLAAILGLITMDANTRIAICFLALGFSLTLIADVFLDILRAHEEMHWVMFLLLLQRVLLLLFGLYGLIRGWGLIWLVSVYVFVSLIHLLASRKLVRHFKGKFHYSFDWNFAVFIFRKSWPFALFAIFGVLNFRLGIYLLSFLKGDTAVGYYGAAHRLIEALTFIPLSMATASFPNFSRLFHVSISRLQDGAGTVFKILFVIALPLAIGTTLFARQIILLIYGGKFYHSALPLQILIWAAFFIFLNSVFINVLQAINRDRQVVAIMGGALLFNIILNIVFIRWLSEAGAALAVLIGELILGLFSAAALSSNLNILSWFRKCGKPMVAAIAMLFILEVFRQINFFLLVALGGVSYTVILKLLNPFTKQEMSWLKTALPREKFAEE